MKFAKRLLKLLAFMLAASCANMNGGIGTGPCAQGERLEGGACISRCSDGYQWYMNQCLPICKDGKQWNSRYHSCECHPGMSWMQGVERCVWNDQIDEVEAQLAQQDEARREEDKREAAKCPEGTKYVRVPSNSVMGPCFSICFRNEVWDTVHKQCVRR